MHFGHSCNSVMIFYAQDEKQIVFLLDEPVVNAIADWNDEHHNHLVIEGFSSKITPRFQLDFHQKLHNTTEIEIKQVYPQSRQSETLTRCFPAQNICGSLTDYEYPYGNRVFYEHPVLMLPDYKLSNPILKIDLRKYFHLINGWQSWTRKTAFSGRYLYSLGPLYLELACKTWFVGIEDGWIKDTVTGKILTLGDSPLLPSDDSSWTYKLIQG